MKDNHIPQKERLERRIAKLKAKLGRSLISRGNPYYKYSNCHKSKPEISISGHYEGCIEPEVSQLEKLHLTNARRFHSCTYGGK